jgi:hypothetical protein
MSMKFLLKLVTALTIFLGVPTCLFAQTGASYNYYFAHLASGGVWRTTFTFVNPTENFATCTTTFYSNLGNLLQLPFGGIKRSVVPYNLVPGGTLHAQTDSDPTGPVLTGWAHATCDGPVKASVLFRDFEGTAPRAEASVPASTTPAVRFVTFSDQITGVAFANPLSTVSTLTFTARDLGGKTLAVNSLTLPGLNHGSFNVGPFLGLRPFQGSLSIDATSPIISLALDFESAPIFSALPPGQDDSTADFKIPISSIDVVEIQGDDNQYLGLVSFAKRTDLNSVFNPLGSYGAPLSQLSIFNTFGTYGSSVSELSAFNDKATRPPSVLINSSPVGKLTTNQSIKDAIDPWYLLGYIRGKNY